MRLVVVASKPTDAVTYGFLPAAERLGLEVLLLTDQPEATARAVARGEAPPPRIVECDVHDAGALIACIAGLPAPDAVFSNSDRLQTQTALAAAYFGRPGKDWRSCLRAKNKPLMRARLAETGAEKVAAAELTVSTPLLPDLPYPVVLKPAEGVASEDVMLVTSAEELKARCAEIFGRRPGERLIAEEFLPGTLRTLETLGDGQATWVLGGFRTTLSPPPFFIEERLTWEPPVAEVAHVRRALADLGVSFGACHTEFICDGQGGRAGARLVEVNDRLIGDHGEFLLNDLLEEDLFERVLRVHLGEPLPTACPPVRPHHAINDFIVAERCGLLAAAPPASAGPGVSYWPLRQPGEHITVTHSNRDYLGVINAIGPDQAAVEHSVAAFRARGRWEIAS